MLVLAACVGLGSATSGCFVEDNGPPVDGSPAEMSIDTGATLDVTPGDGAGMFVEYGGGGHWNVFTACDTAISPSGTACTFDILISADPGVVLSNVLPQDLDPADSLTLQSDGTIHLVAQTSTGGGGVSFDADPGAVIEIDMLLDGIAQPFYVNWIGDGVAQQGAPTNPVDFAPTSP
jgi:hypothetical protein